MIDADALLSLADVITNRENQFGPGVIAVQWEGRPLHPDDIEALNVVLDDRGMTSVAIGVSTRQYCRVHRTDPTSDYNGPP